MKCLKPLLLALFLGVTTVLAYAQDDYQQSSQSFSRAELDQMLAPIALYPDSVLSHILIAATYPLEVVKADRWRQSNSKIKPDKAIKAVESESWDPSVKALVSFADILKRMSTNLDWTQRVGDAFLEDEALVMDVIQGLRQRAFEAGNLNDMQYAKAFREDKVIIIEPSVERVVYVPYYDTRAIYGHWWWPNYPPVYWSSYYQPRHSHISAGFYWGPRVYVGSSFFFSAFHWPNRHVVVVDSHRHRKNYSWGYTSRAVSKNRTAKHWQHNPSHRGSVSYRSKHLHERYRKSRNERKKTFHPHDKNRNPKKIHWQDGSKRQEFNAKKEYRRDRSARDKGDREQKSSYKGRKDDYKRHEGSKHKYSDRKERSTKNSKQKSPKDIRWNNAPPQHKSKLRGDRNEQKSSRNRSNNDKKSSFRGQGGERTQEKRSAPVTTEPERAKTTKFRPREERNAEKVRAPKSHFKSHRNVDRKRESGYGR